MQEYGLQSFFVLSCMDDLCAYRVSCLVDKIGRTVYELLDQKIQQKVGSCRVAGIVLNYCESYAKLEILQVAYTISMQEI